MTKAELNEKKTNKVVTRALNLVRSLDKPANVKNSKKRIASTLLSINELVAYQQFDKSERIKFRKIDIDDFADWARDYANEGVGKKRTQKFDVTKYLSMVPLDRIIIDPEKILGKMVDIASD